MIEVHALALPHLNYRHDVLICAILCLHLEYFLLFRNQLIIALVLEIIIKVAEAYWTLVLLFKVDLFSVGFFSIQTQLKFQRRDLDPLGKKRHSRFSLSEILTSLHSGLYILHHYYGIIILLI
jgi:hypothetical protein